MRDTAARAAPPPDGSDPSYAAMLALLGETARGRAFLEEYARRSRAADTTSVLAAVGRIEAALRGEELPASAPEYLHLGLVAMSGLVTSVQGDIAALAAGLDTPEQSAPRIKRVIGTLRDLGDCVQVMLDGWDKPSVAETAQADPNAPPRGVPLSVVGAHDGARDRLPLSNAELLALFS